MDDDRIMDRISTLVDREHVLRTRRQNGGLGPDTALELRELAEVQVELDQCWDLLRQRRATREYGGNADDARARPASTVEGYLQ